MEPIDLGSRLKELRIEKNYEQKRISEEFSLSRGTYSLYESNQRRPSYEILVKFADYYNVSVDYLLGRDDSRTVTEFRKFSSYSENEMGIIHMVHEMDNIHQKSAFDFVKYVYDLYKKEILNQRNAVS